MAWSPARLNYSAVLVCFFFSSLSVAPVAAQTRLYVLYGGAVTQACTQTDCDPGRLVEVDLDRRTIVANTPVFNARVNASGPRITPDGRFVIWTGAEAFHLPTYLSLFDTATREYRAVARLANDSSGLALHMHPAMTRAFMHAASAPNIIVASPAGFSTLPAGCVFPSLEGMSGDGSRLFVRCSGETAVLDSSTGARVATVPESHFLQTPNASGTELFSAQLGGVGGLYRRWDVSSGRLLAQARVGRQGDAPDEIEVDPRTKQLWAMLSTRGIQVLDPTTLSAVARLDFPLAGIPQVAFDPDNARAFVVSSLVQGNRFRTQLRIVDTDTFSVLMTAELPVQTRIMGAVLAPRAPRPSGLTASVSNRQVTLQWSLDASRAAASEVVIEAGSTPGTADLAQLRVAAGATSLIVTNVPSGIYHVRIRVRNATGSSAVSNEVVVIVP